MVQSKLDRGIALVTILVALLGPLVTTAALAYLLTRTVPPSVPAMPLTKDKPYFAIELERFADEVAARSRVSPDVAGLFEDWIAGGEKWVIPPGATSQAWFYVPRQRKNFERDYEVLRRGGFAKIRIYEIHVPPRLTSEELDYHIFRWESMCNVRKKWITTWSSFRHGRYATFVTALGLGSALENLAPLVNECRPGGICLIVSADCRADAFDDVLGWDKQTRGPVPSIRSREGTSNDVRSSRGR